MGQLGDLWTAEEIVLRVNNGEKVILPIWQLGKFMLEIEMTRMEFKAQIHQPYPQVIVISPLGEELKKDKEGNLIL